MEAICSQGLLNEVLDHLTDVGDIITCSAVSKAWRIAVQGIQPRSLVVPGLRYFVDCGDGMLQWLQSLHSQGKSRNLRRFTIEAYPGSDEDDGHSERFGQCAVMMTDFWQLQYCSLEGEFDMMTAMRLLPVSLQHLSLGLCEPFVYWPVLLSTFSRFAIMQFLAIDVFARHGTDEKHFELDTVLPMVTHLHLRHGTLVKTTHHSTTTCLPNLQHLVAHVCLQHANDYLSLLTLLYIGLELCPEPTPEPTVEPEFECRRLDSARESLGQGCVTGSS